MSPTISKVGSTNWSRAPMNAIGDMRVDDGVDTFGPDARLVGEVPSPVPSPAVVPPASAGVTPSTEPVSLLTGPPDTNEFEFPGSPVVDGEPPGAVDVGVPVEVPGGPPPVE